VLNAVRQADVLVMASPVYFGDLSGQLKCFFDRTYSCINPDFSCRMPPGKKVIMVLAQANPDPAQFADIFSRYERWLKLYGCDPIRLLRVTGVREPGEVASQATALDSAAALARELLGKPKRAWVGRAAPALWRNIIGHRRLQGKGAWLLTCPDIYSPLAEIYSPVEDNKGLDF
jgi:hypothetical protein